MNERQSRRERFLASVKVQALPATSILINARKSVENNGVFSLSFRSFLSLFLRNKRERKGHLIKTFYFKIILTFFFFEKARRKK